MSAIPAGLWASEPAVQDGFVTVAEACKFLGISRTKLYEILGSGELPSAKIGRSRRIPKRSLVAYAASRLVSSL